MKKDEVEQNRLRRIRCPDCLNYIKVKVDDTGFISGTCIVCKTRIDSKQCSDRERRIRIIKFV